MLASAEPLSKDTGMKTTTKPTGNSFPVLRQICNLVPRPVFNALCVQYGFDTRGYSEWSHLVTMLYAHLSRASSLNDVCDGLRMHSAALACVKGATPPSKNNLSNCNKSRNADFMEALYWQTLEFLCQTNGGFGSSKCRKGYLRRFKKAIHAVDSTTVQLVAKNLGWAKHRKRKAAAKIHMRIGLQGFLPKFAVVKEAATHDAPMAYEVCAALQSGEIVAFDKAYLDFPHLARLDARGVHWVTRAKDNTQLEVVRRRKTNHPRVIADEEVVFVNTKSRTAYPKTLRRVTALVEVDGREQVMTFLTNNLEWSAWTVAQLYGARWDIEVFFKEIKQTIQLTDFLGNNANAVRWQIWAGLLTHLLLRFLAWRSSWGHAFSRIAAVIRASLWQRWDLIRLLHSYGTAPPAGGMSFSMKQAIFSGFT